MAIIHKGQVVGSMMYKASNTWVVTWTVCSHARKYFASRHRRACTTKEEAELLYAQLLLGIAPDH